jgi:hypothetical protein
VTFYPFTFFARLERKLDAGYVNKYLLRDACFVKTSGVKDVLYLRDIYSVTPIIRTLVIRIVLALQVTLSRILQN